MYLRGPVVPCNSTLLAGADVVPRCKPLYHNNGRVYYRHVKCNADGTWDKEFFKCSSGRLYMYNTYFIDISYICENRVHKKELKGKICNLRKIHRDLLLLYLLKTINAIDLTLKYTG